MWSKDSKGHKTVARTSTIKGSPGRCGIACWMFFLCGPAVGVAPIQIEMIFLVTFVNRFLKDYCKWIVATKCCRPWPDSALPEWSSLILGDSDSCRRHNKESVKLLYLSWAHEGCNTVFLFCFVFATPHGLRDLCSSTRDWTPATAVKGQNSNH